MAVAMNRRTTRPLFVSLQSARLFNGATESGEFQVALENYFATDATQLQLVRCQKRADTSVVIEFILDPLVFCRRFCVFTGGPVQLTLTGSATAHEFAIGVSENAVITYYQDVRHLPYLTHLSFDLLQEAMCSLLTTTPTATIQ